MHVPFLVRPLALALVLFPLALPAQAAQLQLQGGRSYMGSGDFGANTAWAELIFDEHRLGNTGFSWSPDVSLGWINSRNVARYRGDRYGTGDEAWLLAGGVRVHYGEPGDWYRSLFFSFQPAVNTARTQALSSAYEFVSTLGWQGKRFSFQLRHVSNARLHEPNRGETMALLGIAFDL